MKIISLQWAKNGARIALVALVALVACNQDPSPKCPEPKEPPVDPSCMDTLGQLKESRAQLNKCLEDSVETLRGETRALKLVAQCCMVDEVYPDQCTDPACPFTKKSP